MLNDILDEQENSIEHTKNLLQLSGSLTADKELELAELHYRQIEEHYQKYKYIYDKDEKAYRDYIEAKKDAQEDLHDAATELIDSLLDELDDSVCLLGVQPVSQIYNHKKSQNIKLDFKKPCN